MKIQQRVSLQRFNTLALPGRAEYFCSATSDDDLDEALDFARSRKLAVTILGGGSNIVLYTDVAGLVVHMASSGINLVRETANGVEIGVAAGENWSALVDYCLQQSWYGLENLSLIPGSAGAAPIQNIGAYGVELADRLRSVAVLDIATGDRYQLSVDDCRLGYRDSIFKGELKGKVMVHSIVLALAKHPRVNLGYPELQRSLEHVSSPSPKEVAAAVCRLRREKLPDPAVTPNAGSFFKNPKVTDACARRLRALYEDIPLFPTPDDEFKVPAAWLIDRAGWKGYRRGCVGVHHRQALVLVHFGGGCGEELLALATEIATDIENKFGLTLDLEPEVIGGVAVAGL